MVIPIVLFCGDLQVADSGALLCAFSFLLPVLVYVAVTFLLAAGFLLSALEEGNDKLLLLFDVD